MYAKEIDTKSEAGIGTRYSERERDREREERERERKGEK